MEKSPEKIIRAFLALDFSPTAQELFAQLIQKLKAQLGCGRWVRPDQIHLTLFYLGEVSTQKLSAVSSAMKTAVLQISPFELTVHRLGVFPQRGTPRILWTGFEGDLVKLRHLQQVVSLEMAGLGFFPETRSFIPHVTLARFALNEVFKGVSGSASEYLSKIFPPFRIDSLALFQSKLSPEGAEYSVLDRFLFK